MNYVLTPFVIFSAATAVIAAVLAFLFWKRRKISGGTSLFLIAVAVIIWAGGSAMEYAAVDLGTKLAWAKFEYLGSTAMPVLFLIFTLEYSRLDQGLSRRGIAGLFVVPLITIGLALTNEWHGLIWPDFEPDPFGHNLIIYGHGVGFWIGVVIYSYVCTFLGIASLYWTAIRSHGVYRRQATYMLVGAIIPWVGNLVYVTRINTIKGFEPTPLAAVVAGMIFAWCTLRFQLLDLVPVARDMLIEVMPDGMLVLDEFNRVVDINPAAKKLFKVNEAPCIGRPAAALFRNWPELLRIFDEHIVGRSEIIMDELDRKHAELDIKKVVDRHGRSSGRVVTIRDISERKRAEEDSRTANERLRFQLTEIETLQSKLREQAIRDSLTGLYNRRYLDEMLERELARARRDRMPVCVVMMDIDRFKSFNDTYGHGSGDALLRALGRTFKAQTRARDIVCRYGGEEFILVLPGITAERAFSRIEQLRSEFANTGIPFRGQILRTTLSGGIVTFPDQGGTADEILRAVDRALYAAKAAGRDCLVIGEPVATSGG